MKFALEKCQVYAGEPPAEVKHWRARMATVLWPNGPKTKAEARRKFLWDYVLNGDVRLEPLGPWNKSSVVDSKQRCKSSAWKAV